MMRCRRAVTFFPRGRLWKVVVFIVVWLIVVQVVLWQRSDRRGLAIVKYLHVQSTDTNSSHEREVPRPNKPNIIQHRSPLLLVPSSTACFAVSDSRGEEHGKRCPFILVVTFTRHNPLANTQGVNVFAHADQSSVSLLTLFLEASSEYDAATCLQPRSRDTPNISSWCMLARREWSLIIRNTGPEKEIVAYLRGNPGNSSSAAKFDVQECNIVEGPFVIRASVFEKLGRWKSQYGKASLLDFFLRSLGKLRIAKLKNCAWSEGITKVDRGKQNGVKEFQEYVNFGNDHGILRIIKEDGVEWTRCIANHLLCPEKLYSPPTTLPEVGLPICCSVVVYTILDDFAKASDELGIQYRVVYGTLLGAVRSNAIIPWTYDADVAIDRTAFDNSSTYEEFQKVFGDKYYIGNSYMNMPRMHALYPPSLHLDTTRFFSGPLDLQADAFFSPRIQKAVQGMLPISSSWREQTYLDIYYIFDAWLSASATVTINNRTFATIKEIDYELTNWYGKHYRAPVLRGTWFGMSDRGAV